MLRQVAATELVGFVRVIQVETYSYMMGCFGRFIDQSDHLLI